MKGPDTSARGRKVSGLLTVASLLFSRLYCSRQGGVHLFVYRSLHGCVLYSRNGGRRTLKYSGLRPRHPYHDGAASQMGFENLGSGLASVWCELTNVSWSNAAYPFEPTLGCRVSVTPADQASASQSKHEGGPKTRNLCGFFAALGSPELSQPTWKTQTLGPFRPATNSLRKDTSAVCEKSGRYSSGAVCLASRMPERPETQKSCRLGGPKTLFETGLESTARKRTHTHTHTHLSQPRPKPCT